MRNFQRTVRSPGEVYQLGQHLGAGLEGFFSLLKRTLGGTYVAVAPFRYNERKITATTYLTHQGEQMQPVTTRTLDDEVKRSPAKCPGGRYCECCGPRCDCGCRDACPKFRNLIAAQIRERDESSK